MSDQVLRKPTPKAVCVLGMHRSGTSVITRGIVVLGACAGDNLIPAGVDNPTGFWEDRDFVDLNDILLRTAGQSYESLAYFSKDLGQRLSGMKEQAKELVSKKIAAHAPWVVKDPRASRLLTFWRPVFEELGLDVSYVIAIRNPLSVAHSLQSRNQFPIAKSLLLWLEHYLTVVSETHEARRVFIGYESLLKDPGAELRRLSDALGFARTREVDAEIDLYARTFVSPELSHAHYSPDDLSASGDVPASVSESYDLLRKQCVRRDWGTDGDFVAQWQRLVSVFEENAGFMDFLQERDKAALYKAIELKKLNDRLVVRDKEAADAAKELLEKDGALGELKRALLERDGELNRAIEFISNATQELAESEGASEREGAGQPPTLGTSDRQVRTVVPGKATGIGAGSPAGGAGLVGGDGEPVGSLDYSSMGSEEIAVRLKGTLLELDRATAPLLRAIGEYTGESGALESALGSAGKVADLYQRLRSHGTRLKGLSEDSLLASAELARRHERRGLPGLLRALGIPLNAIRRRSSLFVTYVWRRLPISRKLKNGLRDRLFGALPFIFQRTDAYRRWREFTSFSGGPASHGEAAGDDNLWVPSRSSDYVPCLASDPPPAGAVRLICFYLPQFHCIPENDAWWGKGFTEWSNVIPAKPQFEGHYQPHLPGEMGCYNLLDPSVQRRQVELAKLYGIGGFCFYFYWFGGKRLLEDPLNNYLADCTLDLPFCLCWANENWSRRWDGLDSEILISQHHSSDDDLAFIAHVARYMRDPRYIRIDGKPLLVVYRPSLLPSARDTAKRWRDWCKGNGIGSIYLAYTQSFESVDPASYGFDGAIEFPPNNSAPPDITATVQPLDKDFAGTVYDWRVFVQRSGNYRAAGYRLFRSVCCSWDNTARRKNKGTIFLGSTPNGYREWLHNAIADTCKRFRNVEERLVFINAWNEWAEGAHLEPDARYGYAWLQATRDALTSEMRTAHIESRKIVVVTHDAFPHGAQYLALNITKELSTSLGCEVEVVCLGGGVLKAEFKRYARFYDFEGVDPQGNEARALAEDLYQRGFKSAIVNTVVSAALLPVLKQAGLRCVSLVHELGGVIKAGALQGQARQVAQYADQIVFAAIEVREAFCSAADVDAAKLVIRPQGLYKRNPHVGASRAEARARLRNELALPDDAKVVVGVGYADHRKGVDYFADIASAVRDVNPLVHFVWVGHWEAGMQRAMDRLKERRPSLFDNLHFVGRREDTSIYYAGADLFALTSREDPFPSVVLESMDAGLPVVAFAGSGGSNGLIEEGIGQNVVMGDTATFATVVVELINDEERRREMGGRGRDLIRERFSFRQYLFDLLELSGLGLRKVSVIIPNYNYERYLNERINSIICQTYPIYEIIFLDDASTDSSVDVAIQQLADVKIDYRTCVNARNSRSVFAQWRRGVELARGDIIWIAEADDVSDPAFLAVVIKGFDDPEVVLSYCESMQIDEEGTVLAGNYHDYVSDVDDSHWKSHYINVGHEEIQKYLAVKNTIPNVSAVLMGRRELAKVLNEHFPDVSRYRVAGDWKIYIHLIAGARLAYFPQSLNLHRRHGASVTLSSFDAAQLEEIRDIQQWSAKTYACEREVVKKATDYLGRLQARIDVREARG